MRHMKKWSRLFLLTLAAVLALGMATLAQAAEAPDADMTAEVESAMNSGGAATRDGGTLSEVYVATTGDDSNDGTQENPVKTINQALTMVAEGGTIWVAEGTYNCLNNPITISFSVTISGVEGSQDRTVLQGVDISAPYFGGVYKSLNINHLTLDSSVITLANGTTLFENCIFDHTRTVTRGNGGGFFYWISCTLYESPVITRGAGYLTFNSTTFASSTEGAPVAWLIQVDISEEVDARFSQVIIQKCTFDGAAATSIIDIPQVPKQLVRPVTIEMKDNTFSDTDIDHLLTLGDKFGTNQTAAVTCTNCTGMKFNSSDIYSTSCIEPFDLDAMPATIDGAPMTRYEPPTASVYGIPYSTLKEALEMGYTKGETTLLRPVIAQYDDTDSMWVRGSTYLDLAGHDLETTYIRGDLRDSTDGGALLKITTQQDGQDNLELSNTSHLALYDSSAGGYRLYPYDFKSVKTYVGSEDSVEFWFQLTFSAYSSTAWQLLARDAANSKLSINAKLSVVGEAETVQIQFTPEVIRQVAQMAPSNGQINVGFYVRVKNLKSVSGATLSFAPSLVFTGATRNTNGLTYSVPSAS